MTKTSVSMDRLLAALGRRSPKEVAKAADRVLRDTLKYAMRQR